MDFKPPRKTIRSGPEAAGAKRLRLYMEARGWHTEKLHGNKYQTGLPDLLCVHIAFGVIFIETKAPGEKLSSSQHLKFVKLETKGAKIYVCESELHYERIFHEPNWRNYIRW